MTHVELLILFLCFQLAQNKDFVVHLLKKEKRLNYRRAKKFCEDNYNGGSLAVISDEVSKEKIQRKLYDEANRNSGAVLRFYWIGLQRLAANEFVWHDGSKNIDHLFPWKERKYGGNCIQLRALLDFKPYPQGIEVSASNYYCTPESNFICQKNDYTAATPTKKATTTTTATTTNAKTVTTAKASKTSIINTNTKDKATTVDEKITEGAKNINTNFNANTQATNSTSQKTFNGTAISSEINKVTFEKIIKESTKGISISSPFVWALPTFLGIAVLIGLFFITRKRFAAAKRDQKSELSFQNVVGAPSSKKKQNKRINEKTAFKQDKADPDPYDYRHPTFCLDEANCKQTYNYSSNFYDFEVIKHTNGLIIARKKFTRTFSKPGDETLLPNFVETVEVLVASLQRV